MKKLVRHPVQATSSKFTAFLKSLPRSTMELTKADIAKMAKEILGNEAYDAYPAGTPVKEMNGAAKGRLKNYEVSRKVSYRQSLIVQATSKVAAKALADNETYWDDLDYDDYEESGYTITETDDDVGFGY